MTNERYDHAPLVESWLKETVWLPETDIARVAQLVHQTPQRRYVLPRIDLGRFQPMFSATKIVAGALVVALFSGLLLSGVLPAGQPDQPLPAAATGDATQVVEATAEATRSTPALELPDELPVGSRTGTIPTELGPLRWVYLSGPNLALEDEGLAAATRLVPWDDGIAAVLTMFGESFLASTMDGVRWDPQPLPGKGVLGAAGGAAVLVSAGSGQVWARELDGGSWQELDASAVGDASLPLGWKRVGSRRVHAPIELDGRTVFRLSQRYRLPREDLGIPKTVKTKKLRRVDDEVYALCGRGSCPNGGRKAKWQVSFDETQAGLSVRDERTGRILGTIDGADASQLFDGAEATWEAAFTIDGSRVAPFELDESTTMTLDDVSRAMWDPRDWFVHSPGQGVPPQIRVGDDWISLESLGISEEWVQASRLGEIALISSDPLSNELETWILTLPEGT